MKRAAPALHPLAARGWLGRRSTDRLGGQSEVCWGYRRRAAPFLPRGGDRAARGLSGDGARTEP